MRRLRLLTLGHSYVVGTNRRLAHALAREGGEAWEVVVAAPTSFPGDLGPLELDVAADEPVRVVGIPVRMAGRIHLMTWRRGLRALMREPWDVVHLWEEPFVAAGAQAAALAPKGAALAVATFQNLPKRYPPPFGWMERRTMRRADGWIAFGQTVRETLRGRPGYDLRPFRVIPPGVDVALFRPDAEARRATLASLGWEDDGTPVLGFLGRFVAEKGLALLLDVLDGLRTPFRALLIGGGPLEDEARRRVASSYGRVRVVTGVQHGEVPRWLAAMDLLCAPSRTTPRWREQYGRMAAEAMACGVPVAASDSGELPHVVGDGGVVLPEADLRAWTAEVDVLLADADRRRALGAKARARAVASLSLEVSAREHLDFFGELARGRRR